MENSITDGFPYSKQDFGNLCATLDLLILNVCKNASQQYTDSQVAQILKSYQSMKYPLLAIWEYYGFGEINEISSGLTSMVLYQASKIVMADTLCDLISGISSQNPFDFYGKINNSDKIVEKLLKVYKHLLANLQSGRLIL